MSDTKAPDPFAPQHRDWRSAAGVERISRDADAHFALMDMLVDLRKRRHTMREVAEDMGVNEAQVADIESEDSNPTLSKLQSYARAVGVRVRFLVESPTWRREELGGAGGRRRPGQRVTADRLRDAADRLAPSWVDAPEFCHPGCLSCQHNRTTAALLRAVAEDGPFAVDAETGEVYGTRPPTWDAALALADVILGGES